VHSKCHLGFILFAHICPGYQESAKSNVYNIGRNI
jgi:hypothetical protein